MDDHPNSSSNLVVKRETSVYRFMSVSYTVWQCLPLFYSPIMWHSFQSPFGVRLREFGVARLHANSKLELAPGLVQHLRTGPPHEWRSPGRPHFLFAGSTKERRSGKGFPTGWLEKPNCMQTATAFKHLFGCIKIFNSNHASRVLLVNQL